MDAVCETSGYVYIFEFKMSNAPDGSSDAALQQIENQEYDIPRGEIISHLTTNVVTYVGRKIIT